MSPDPAPAAGFAPDLRLARFLPRGVTPDRRRLRLVRAATRLSTSRPGTRAAELPVAPGVTVRLHRPATLSTPAPALLWVHGGGLVSGNARMDERFCARVRDELGVVVASVEYRLAPEHPFPAPLEDCWAALTWLAAQPEVDPDRVAIGGASAGGNLAAALAIAARDRGGVHPVFQLLVYPMLDDRTTLRTDVDERLLRLWDQRSNRFGWGSYLGASVGTDAVSPLAAPARSTDLAGLAPAWVGVGTLDLFHDEDVAYAHRLREAGVDCALDVVPGAYHGFDAAEAWAPVARAFTDAQLTALSGALHGG
jgi:acetyl esterase/lipase